MPVIRVCSERAAVGACVGRLSRCLSAWLAAAFSTFQAFPHNSPEEIGASGSSTMPNGEAPNWVTFLHVEMSPPRLSDP